MNNETISTLTSNLTIMSSIIAIASVTICALLTSIITQRGARKTKQIELIFQEKIEAYYEFLYVSDHFDNLMDRDQTMKMANTSTKALLFASSDTEFLINQYTSSIITYFDIQSSGSPETSQYLERMVFLRNELIKSMRNDLLR